MKAVKVETLQMARRQKDAEYAGKLDELARMVKDAQDRRECGTVSTHDAFNMAARTQDLQEVAGQIALIENLIRFAEEL